MAQGEFGLVRELLTKGMHKETMSAGEADLYAMLADAAVQQYDVAGLREYTPKLEESAKPLDHRLYLATAHRAWGVLHRLEAKYDKAEMRLQEAVAIFIELDTRWQLGRTYLELGQLAQDRAEPQKAKDSFSKALELFEEMGAVPDAARTLSALSELAG